MENPNLFLFEEGCEWPSIVEQWRHRGASEEQHDSSTSKMKEKKKEKKKGKKCITM